MKKIISGFLFGVLLSSLALAFYDNSRLSAELSFAIGEQAQLRAKIDELTNKIERLIKNDKSAIFESRVAQFLMELDRETFFPPIDRIVKNTFLYSSGDLDPLIQERAVIFQYAIISRLSEEELSSLKDSYLNDLGVLLTNLADSKKDVEYAKQAIEILKRALYALPPGEDENSIKSNLKRAQGVYEKLGGRDA